jgi:signal peptidase I
MGKAEGREEKDEAGRAGRNPAGSLSGRAESPGVAPSEKARRKSTVREYAETLAVAVLLALFIRTFVVQAFKIPSGSMIPTLKIGDHILVNKFLYGVRIPYFDLVWVPFSRPQRGDIIVFKYPKDEEKDFIKRVIGLPGDTVQMKDKEVYVNGQRLEESYAIHQEENEPFARMIPEKDNYGPVSVPADSYFVMGDNRDQSLDSRFWGFVHFNKIKGKAFVIYWSWDGSDRWVRWERIGKLIH